MTTRGYIGVLLILIGGIAIYKLFFLNQTKNIKDESTI